MATTTANYNGTVQGQFSIDSNGGATYTVPLPLPPGTAGMMPALSLVYNTGGGNLLPVDVNGDGLTDLLYSTNANTKLQWTRALSSGPYPDMLTTINNGLGGQR